MIVSGFGADGNSEVSLKVDFSTAKRLDRGGSTCDAYECTIQHRMVFIKRLKAEFRNNPFYLSAFDKEYNIGVSFSHPSLPRYVGFGSEYIIMDYIEGETLDALIKQGDPRLKDKKFCRKILSELIDVVKYLHYRSIVHCDIKPDNVMIQPYVDRPIKLIDFDKTYTAWLGGTAGDPTKYDCDDCADGKIDFHGIGRIAEKLGQKCIASACMDKDADISSIRKALFRSEDRSRIWKWIIAVGGAVVLYVAMLWEVNRIGNGGRAPDSPAVLSANTLMIEQNHETGRDSVADTWNQELYEKATADDYKESRVQRPKDNATASIGELEEIVRLHYGPLSRRHDYLRRLVADSRATVEQLQKVIEQYTDDQTKAQNQIIRKVTELYGLSNPFESVTVLGQSEEWNRFMKDNFEIIRLYSREIKRSRQEERPGDAAMPGLAVEADSLSR